MDDTIECPYCHLAFSVTIITDILPENEPESPGVEPEAPVLPEEIPVV